MLHIGKLGVGRLVRLAGVEYTVQRIDHGVNVVLYARSTGGTVLRTVEQLQVEPGAELLDVAHTSGYDDGVDEVLVRALPADVVSEAMERRAHILEALTGYRAGKEGQARPGEPQDRYNPALHSMTKRLETKAVELDVDRATIFRWRGRWTKCRDITAFVNSKRLEPRVTRIARLDRRLLQAIFDEMDATVDASSATKDAFRRAVSYRCKQAHGADIFTRLGGIREPQDSTYNRVLSDVGHPRGFFNGTSEARRGIALRPKRAYQPRQAEWPGELVLFDSSGFDAMLYDPVSQTFCKFDIHIAFDLATRSIVGRRFEPAGTTGVDAAFLLLDVMRPKPMRPEWPVQAGWRYVGIPEEIVVDLGENRSESRRLAGVPVVLPFSVVGDRALAYTSDTFLRALDRYGINFEPARPLHPTDKAALERMFRTIREDFTQYLAGYTGGRVHRRGKAVENDAVLVIHEVEEAFDEWVALEWQNRPHDGLRPATDPRSKWSPNVMFEEAINRCGYIRVPDKPHLYYELLPLKARVIHDDGVKMFGLRYDGDNRLNRFRDQRSPYEDIGGKWHISHDPRDLRQVYFFDPDRRTWLALPWKGQHHPDRPFDDRAVAYAKRRLVRTGDIAEDERRLQEQIEALGEARYAMNADARSRRAAADARARATGAARDAAVAEPMTDLFEEEEENELAPAPGQPLPAVPAETDNGGDVDDDDDGDYDGPPVAPYPTIS